MGEGTGTREKQWIRADTYKAKVCEYLLTYPKAVAVDIAKATKMTVPQLQHYLRVLREGGYIEREGVKRTAHYSATPKKYVSKYYQSAEIGEQPHIKIYRLLDRPQVPQPKSKKRKGHLYGGMQSSMQSFGGW